MGGESKQQPYLNGAYYGPSIPPPPSNSYHRPGKSSGAGGGCCCNPLTCCCGCLMNCLCTCIFQIICTLLVIAAVVIAVVWFVFRPNAVKFHATNATLTEFNFDDNNNNNNLRYDLALNLTIRNPNKRLGIYYDGIEARAYYQGQRFAATQLKPFFQGTKSTSYASAEFRGQNLVVLGDKARSRFRGDLRSGVYDVEVKLYLRMRLKFWFVKSMRMKPKIDCDLKIPLSSSNGTTVSVYKAKKCDFDWH